MPCASMVQKRAQRLRLKVPDNLTEIEVRELVGAIDHDDFHRIMDSMSDFDFAEYMRRLWERRTGKVSKPSSEMQVYA